MQIKYINISIAFFIFSLVSLSALRANEVQPTILSDAEISKILREHTAPKKPLEQITLLDVLENEDVSPELKQRIVNLLDQSQYEIDKYRSVMNNYYKQVETKLLEFKSEINGIQDFRSKMELTLDLSKWMIISLSIGIICLTLIVIIMWRSVINVNRNDVEVIFMVEKFKKELKILDTRIDTIEVLIKKDGNQ